MFGSSSSQASSSGSGKGSKGGSAEETRLLMDDPQSPAVESPSSSHAPTIVTAPPAVNSSSTSAPSKSGANLLPMHQTPPPPSPQQASDFMFIKIIARIVMGLLRKFWAVSSASLLAIVLLYWLCGGPLAFLLVLFGLSGLLYHAGDRLLYHPDQPSTSRVFVPSPTMVGLPFESAYIKAKDRTRLHLFMIKQPGDKGKEAPTLLFLHGNAGNIGHRLLNAKGMYANLDLNLCLLEYRGYGHSDGTPCEEGLYMDAQAGLDYLNSRTDINTSKIIVFGRSLGGAVAIELASRTENRDKISSLVVENTFSSIPDIARTLFDFRLVRMLPNWFFKNQFKSRWKVCRISVPTLFLSGSADQLIPPKMMQELYHSCGAETKKMARFPGGSHNETWSCPQYYATVRYFLDEVVKIGLTASSGQSARPVQSPPPNLVNDSAII